MSPFLNPTLYKFETPVPVHHAGVSNHLSKKASPPEQPPKTPVVAAPGGDYEDDGNVKTLLVLNTNRSHSMQPTLRGMVKLGGKIIDIAAWWSETKDATRDYYSLKYQDSVAAKEAWARDKSRVEPMGASKLYQFRQRNESDPAYVSAEPFLVEGVPYWVLLWVVLPEGFPSIEDATEDDLRMIQYPLCFSRRRPEEKWQPIDSPLKPCASCSCVTQRILRSLSIAKAFQLLWSPRSFPTGRNSSFKMRFLNWAC
jgi:hypothetical protein